MDQSSIHYEYSPGLDRSGSRHPTWHRPRTCILPRFRFLTVIGTQTYQELCGGKMAPDPGTVYHRKLNESARSEY